MNSLTLDKKWLWMGAGVALIALGALYLLRRQAGALGAGVVHAAGDLVGGVVTGVGDVLGDTVQEAGTFVGIPKTNQTDCARALAEGRWWDASFACPAADFLKGVWAGKPTEPKNNRDLPGAPREAEMQRGASGSW